MKRLLLCFGIPFLIVIVSMSAVADPGANQITILYDAFGKNPNFKKDWGYAALLEYNGKRILFDTGNNAEIFEQNVKAAKVDLTNLDFVVISHRHLDHTAGISYLLKMNPNVKIFAPKEAFGMFGSTLPNSFYRRDNTLDEHERYFDNHPPEPLRFGSVWEAGKFEPVEKTFEVIPGVYIIALISDTPGTKELREISLALRGSNGLVLVVGCSHPGIDRIVEAAAAIDPRITLILGGFHLPNAPDEQIANVATKLHDTWRVERLAPGHCTGEPAFAYFKKLWGDHYGYAGVGTVIKLP